MGIFTLTYTHTHENPNPSAWVSFSVGFIENNAVKVFRIGPHGGLLYLEDICILPTKAVPKSYVSIVSTMVIVE